MHLYSKEEAEKEYNKYLEGHIQNVNDALELLNTLDIDYVKDNIDKLRDICKEHDKSKYDEEEYIPYLHHFYPTTEEEADMQEEFDAAVMRHVRNNKHHWNYKDWVDDDNNLRDDFDDEEYKLYTIERICDWLSMGYQHEEETPYGWWDDNREGIVMPDYAVDMVDEILHKVPDDYKLSYQAVRGDLEEDIALDTLNREVVKKLGKRVKKSKTSNAIEIDTQMTNHDEQLNEMTANDIIRKSKNEDPERVNRSNKVKTTYIGMSDFGILNFKTTSQSRSGYHYQTVEFQNMKFFEDIIRSGRAVTPDDVKKAIETQDINVWCTDESFTWWAWGHLAYKYDFLYIDDRIPDLKTRIQAPTVNNVRLNGGSCKHILSVLSYMKKPFTLLAISDDMNAYLNNEETKADKQDDVTKDRADQVKNWDWNDFEEATGRSRAQIMADISKTIQIAPLVNKEEIIADFVNDIPLPEELQGLKKEIIDRTIELIDQDIKEEE